MTDKTELTAAAERRMSKDPKTYGSGAAFNRTQYREDQSTLADLALELLDPTPADEAWLRSEGFTGIVEGDTPNQFGLMPDGLAIQTNPDGQHMASLLVPSATRGMVRALLLTVASAKGERSTATA